MSHKHGFGWATWILLRFHKLLLPYDFLISVQHVKFRYIAVSTIHDCLHWCGWPIWQTKVMSTLWVMRHIDLNRMFFILKRVAYNSFWNFHQLLVRVSKSVRLMRCCHSVSRGKSVQLLVVYVIRVSRK